MRTLSTSLHPSAVRPSSSKKLALAALIGLSFLAQADRAHAASDSWKANAAGSWNDVASWTLGNIPGTGDTATFDFTLSADRTVTVDVDRAIANIAFGANNTNFKYTLSSGNFLLDNGGSIGVLNTATGGTHIDTISTPIAIQGEAGAATFFNNATATTRTISLTGAISGVSTGSNVTTLTLNGTNTGASPTTTNLISGTISDGVGGGSLKLVKNDAGTWRLTGQNTFTGTVEINGGILAVATTGVASTSGALGLGETKINAGGELQITGGNLLGASQITLNGGTLRGSNAASATFSGPIAVTANSTVINNRTSASGTSTTHTYGTLAIGGFALDVGSSNNQTSGTSGVTFGATTVTGNATFNVSNNPANTNTTLLTLGVITGGTNSITKSGNGTLTLNNANTFSGGFNVKGGIATTNNTGGFGSGTITLGDAANNNSALISSSANGTITNAINLETLASGVLTLRGTSGTSGQNVTYSGLITTNTGTPTLQLISTGSGGLRLTNATMNPTVASITAASTGSGAVTITGAIGNNVGAVIQNSTGSSTLVLSGNNASYNNGFFIKAGTLQVTSNNAAIGAATNVITLGDTTGSANATFNVNLGATLANPIVLATGTTGLLTILSPNSSNVANMTGGITGTNNLQLSGTNSQGIRFSLGAIDYVGTLSNIGTGTGAALLDSNITNKVTNVTQNSATSALTLTGTNAYTGTTTITAGVLTFLNTSAMPDYPTPTPGDISVGSGGTLSLGYGAASGQFSAADISAFTAVGTPITFAATGAAIGLDTSTAVGGVATYNSVIANPTGVELGFTKDGAGTLTLGSSNTYTGATAIRNGALSVDSLNNIATPLAASSLGAPTSAATGVIQIGNAGTSGTLIYTGGGETTDRGVNLNGSTGGVTLNQSGTGLLKFTTDFTATGAGDKTLTLTGSTAGSGELNAVIPDNSTANTTALTKSGTGTWTLSKVNTYTGTTSITGGTLVSSIADALGSGALTLNGAGATLDLGLDHPDTVGVVTLTNGTINGTGTSSLTSNAAYALVSGSSAVPLLGTLGATKTGAGFVSLNGASNYSGLTTVSAGFLTFGQRTGFYDGVQANWTDANFLVSAGSTLAFGVGGGNGFTSADLDVLKVVSSVTGGFQAGSNLGFDTTGGDFVYGSSIADTTSGALGLMKLGANKLTLNGALTYTGTTTIHSGTLALGGNQTLTSGVVYGITNNSASVGTLEVTSNVSIPSFLVQTNTATANTLTIASGKTLTVTGAFTVGTGLAASTQTSLNSSGGGALVVNNTATNGLFSIGGTTSGSGNGTLTTADLSGLGSLTVTLDQATGIFRVNPVSGNNVTNKYSILKLPQAGSGNTSITAKTLAVGDGAQNNSGVGQVNQLELGSGVNTIHVDTINVGTGSRDLGSITFGTASGSLIIRNAAGTGAATLNIANAGGGTGATATEGNTFDVRGHNADILINALTIGSQNRGAGSNNTFGWDRGTLDMTSLSAAIRTAQPGTGNAVPYLTTADITLGSTASTLADTAIIQNGILVFGQATGGSGTNGPLQSTATLNIGGGTITIGNTGGVSINMANASQTGGAQATATATINITGGATTMSGHLVHQGGSGITTSTLNLNGGSLNMSGQNIGGTDPANNLTNLVFASGTLSNVGQLNNGGVLDKTTAGTLTIAGVNTYTGATTVTGGKLIVNGTTTSNTSVSALGTLAGIGSISGSLVNDGLVAPGNSIGTLTVIGDATFNAGSSFEAELGASNSSDLLNLTSVGSNLSLLSNTDTLNLLSTGDAGTFTIIDYDGARSGIFDLVNFNGLSQSLVSSSLGITNPGGFTGTGDLYTYGSVSVFYNDSNTSVQIGGIAAIPEPSTLVLGGFALLGFAGYSLRRRRVSEK